MDTSALLTTLLSSSSISNVGKCTNTKPEEVKSVLQAAVPALLKGVTAQTKDSKTAAGFTEALASHAKDYNSNLGSFFKNVDLTDGSKILTHLIGSPSSATTKEIAKKAGVSADKTTSILSAAAPLLMSLLGKEQSSSGSAVTDLVGGLLKNVDVGSLLTGLLGATSTNTATSSGKKPSTAKKPASGKTSSGKTSSSSKKTGTADAASLIGSVLGSMLKK